MNITATLAETLQSAVGSLLHAIPKTLRRATLDASQPNRKQISGRNITGTILMVGMLGTLAACGGGGASTAPLPDANDTLKKAATLVQNSKSLRFKLQLTGAPSFVDNADTISFISADGSYVEPDRVGAKVVAKLLGVPGEVEIAAIGDQQYMKNAVLTAGQWLIKEFAPGFNAQQFIKSDSGIQSAIKSIKDVKIVGRENLFGTDVYHLTGNSTAKEIASLTVGLIRGTDVLVDIYIDVDTGRVDQVVLVQPATKTDTLEATKWVLELFDYDKPDIKIDQPEAQGSAAGGMTLPSNGTIIPANPVNPTATAEATKAQ